MHRILTAQHAGLRQLQLSLGREGGQRGPQGQTVDGSRGAKVVLVEWSRLAKKAKSSLGREGQVGVLSTKTTFVAGLEVEQCQISDLLDAISGFTLFVDLLFISSVHKGAEGKRGAELHSHCTYMCKVRTQVWPSSEEGWQRRVLSATHANAGQTQ